MSLTFVILLDIFTLLNFQSCFHFASIILQIKCFFHYTQTQLTELKTKKDSFSLTNEGNCTFNKVYVLNIKTDVIIEFVIKYLIF